MTEGSTQQAALRPWVSEVLTEGYTQQATLRPSVSEWWPRDVHNKQHCDPQCRSDDRGNYTTGNTATLSVGSVDHGKYTTSNTAIISVGSDDRGKYTTGNTATLSVGSVDWGKYTTGNNPAFIVRWYKIEAWLIEHIRDVIADFFLVLNRTSHQLQWLFVFLCECIACETCMLRTATKWKSW